MKTCSKCKKEKSLSDFFKQKSNKDGYNNICKECCSVYWRKPKEEIENGYKRCTKCKEIKKIGDFGKKHTLKSGIRSSCKECDKIYVKNNIEHYKEYSVKYNLKNKEKNKKYREKYFQENKQTIYERKKEYRNKNKHIFAWKSVLRNSLKRMDTHKEGHTINLLGYSAIELKYHLEKQFTNGMTWNNYGEWHIDHIKPVSSFDKDTPVSIVCALDNLQPLWATTREIDGVIYEGNLNKSNYF
jgi:hypothetical protein